MMSTMTIEVSPMEERVLQAPSAWRAPVVLLNDFERDSDSLESARLYNQLAEAAEVRGHYQQAQTNALRAWEMIARR